jgi:acetoin utilization deacetylase AcuC-like enzyme
VRDSVAEAPEDARGGRRADSSTSADAPARRERGGLLTAATTEHLAAEAAADSEWYVTASHGVLPRPLVGDTYVSPGTEEAMLRACGSMLFACGEVAAGRKIAAFCLVRPPGHHAGRCHRVRRGQGFCLVNNVLVGVWHTLVHNPWMRVAIVDIDTHYGQGSLSGVEHMCRALPARLGAGPHVLFASVHQFHQHHYPATAMRASSINSGATRESWTTVGERATARFVVQGLPLGSRSAAWRRRVHDTVLPEVAALKPDLVLISAGFDGHADDPIGSLRLTTEDFAWVVLELDRVAPNAGLVSILEGGYGFRSCDNFCLQQSILAHVRALGEVALRRVLQADSRPRVHALAASLCSPTPLSPPPPPPPPLSSAPLPRPPPPPPPPPPPSAFVAASRPVFGPAPPRKGVRGDEECARTRPVAPRAREGRPAAE